MGASDRGSVVAIYFIRVSYSYRIVLFYLCYYLISINVNTAEPIRASGVTCWMRIQASIAFILRLGIDEQRRKKGRIEILVMLRKFSLSSW